MRSFPLREATTCCNEGRPQKLALSESMLPRRRASRFDNEANYYRLLPAMLRPVLEERFRLKTHWETRQQQVFALVLARKDGSVGKLLPLRIPRSGPFKVAVMGYFANPASMYLGDYSSDQGSSGQRNEVNGYQGIRQNAPQGSARLNLLQLAHRSEVVTKVPGW